MTTLGAGPAFAQGRTATDFPNRVVRIIVPQSASGDVDTYTRAIAQKLTETWGQQIVVDKRPGANGIIGVEQVAKSKPDGYTLLAAFTSVFVIDPLWSKYLSPPISGKTTDQQKTAELLRTRHAPTPPKRVDAMHSLPFPATSNAHPALR